MTLDLAQMVLEVLEVRKNPKPTQFYMLNIFDFYNYPQKSSPGVVRALGLLLAVYGPGLGPDGPGGPEKPYTYQVLHSKHLWFLQLFPKIKP